MSVAHPLKWISYEEVLHLHARVINETGGGEGVLNLEVIKNAVDAPLQAIGDTELYPTLFDKVAHLIRTLNFHGFVDGNKRISLVVADTVLRRNGYRLRESDALELFWLELAESTKSVEEIVNFLERHTLRQYH
jgi:death-on-curing protein